VRLGSRSRDTHARRRRDDARAPGSRPDVACGPFARVARTRARVARAPPRLRASTTAADVSSLPLSSRAPRFSFRTRVRRRFGASLVSSASVISPRAFPCAPPPPRATWATA
jgi:hypothetical protein